MHQIGVSITEVMSETCYMIIFTLLPIPVPPGASLTQVTAEMMLIWRLTLLSGAGADINEHWLDGPPEKSRTHLTKLGAIAFTLWRRVVTAVSFKHSIQSHFKPHCFEVTLAVRHTARWSKRRLGCQVRDCPSFHTVEISHDETNPIWQPMLCRHTNKVLRRD